MNEIIKKGIDELTKPEPNIDYVRGMLETLYELNQSPIKASLPTLVSSPKFIPPKDEGSLLDSMATARIQDLPPIQME